MTHRLLTSMLATILAGALVGCAGGSTATTPPSSTAPFNLLAVGSLTGATGTLGAACVNGLQTASLVLNSNGGILGHHIQIKTYDSQGNTTQAVSLLQQALSTGTTWNYVISGGSSDEALATGPTITSAKLVTVAENGLLSLGDPTKYPYRFLDTSNSDIISKFVVDYASKQGFKKLALLTEDNAYGQQERASYTTNLKAANIQFVDQVFAATAVDVSPALLQLQAAGVDGVIWNALGASVGYVLKSRLKVGFMVPFIGDIGVSSSDLPTLSGSAAALKNVVMQSWAIDVTSPSWAKDPNFNTFVNTLHQVAVIISQPLHSYALCYDGLQAYNIAAKQAGSLDPDKVKNAMEHLTLPSTSPLVVFGKGFGWTPQSHVQVNQSEQFIITKPGPLTDGQVVPGSY